MQHWPSSTSTQPPTCPRMFIWRRVWNSSLPSPNSTWRIMSIPSSTLCTGLEQKVSVHIYYMHVYNYMYNYIYMYVHVYVCVYIYIYTVFSSICSITYIYIFTLADSWQVKTNSLSLCTTCKHCSTEGGTLPRQKRRHGGSHNANKTTQAVYRKLIEVVENFALLLETHTLTDTTILQVYIYICVLFYHNTYMYVYNII